MTHIDWNRMRPAFVTLFTLCAVLGLISCDGILQGFYADFREAETAVEEDVFCTLEMSRSFALSEGFSADEAELSVLLLPYYMSVDGSETLQPDRILETSLSKSDFDDTVDGIVEVSFNVPLNARYRVFIYLDNNRLDDGSTVAYGNGKPDFSDPMRLAEIQGQISGSDSSETMFDFTYRTAGTMPVELYALLECEMRLSEEDLWVLEELMVDSGAAANEAPEAVITVNDALVQSKKEIQFSASDSSDEDGWIVSWEWGFGNGAYASGEEVFHTFPFTEDDFPDNEDGGKDPLTRTVLLTVTDNRGGIDTDELQVTILPPEADWVYRALEFTGTIDTEIPRADLDSPLRAALFRADGVDPVDLFHVKTVGIPSERYTEGAITLDEDGGTYAVLVWLDTDEDGVFDPEEYGDEITGYSTVDGTVISADTTYRLDESDEYQVVTFTSEDDPPTGEHEVYVTGEFEISPTSETAFFFYDALNPEGAAPQGTKSEPVLLSLNETYTGTTAMGRSSFYFVDVSGYENNSQLYTVRLSALSRDVDFKAYRAVINTEYGISDYDKQPEQPPVFVKEAWEDAVLDADDEILLVRLVGNSYFTGTEMELDTFRVPGGDLGTEENTNYLLLEVMPNDGYATYSMRVDREEINAAPTYSRDNPFMLDKAETNVSVAEDDVLYFRYPVSAAGTYTVTLSDYSPTNDVNLEGYADPYFMELADYSYVEDPEEYVNIQAIEGGPFDTTGYSIYFRITGRNVVESGAEGVSCLITVTETVE